MHCDNSSAPAKEAHLAELTRAGVILNILNRVYGYFFQYWLKQLNTNDGNYFVQDYLQQNSGEFSWEREL